MKDFTIFLTGTQPQDHVVLMGRKTVTGEIVVTAIPFHEILTASGGLVLDEAKLESIVRSFLDPETGVGLRAACTQRPGLRSFERGGSDMVSAVSAEMGKHGVLGELSGALWLGTEKTGGALRPEARTGPFRFALITADVDAIVKASMGQGETELVPDIDVAGCVKTAFERLADGQAMKLYVDRTEKRDLERFTGEAVVSFLPLDLFYKLFTGGGTGTVCQVAVEDTDIHFSLGEAVTGVELAAQWDPAGRKSIRADTGLSVLAACKVMSVSVLDGTETVQVLEAVCDAVRRRYRLLAEADVNTISAMDGRTLNDLDLESLD